MALQGDLQSFALPDVLRLLAGTGKSGLLEVSGPAVVGELSLQGGGVLRGTVSSAPRAEHAAEVLLELLRLQEGSFAFAEGEQGDGPTTDVEAALAEAEALVQAWAEVESVVPSMEAWITLAGEPVADTIQLSAPQWRTIAAIGGGGNVRDLAVALGLGDLDACRTVKELAEASLVDVRLSHAAVAPTPEPAMEAYDPNAIYDDLGAYEPFEPLGGEASADPVGMTELEDLVVEDRPVVMEESDDALLPEPLPGEGVAYDGSDLTGVVDGRHVAHPDEPHGAVDSPLDDAAAAFAAFDGFETSPIEEPSHEHAFSMAPAPPVEAYADDAGSGEPVDEERDSLLRFLSSVKP